MPPAAVKVNVYDLGDFNGYMKWLGLGVYHTGVEVYGKEYAFGGAHLPLDRCARCKSTSSRGLACQLVSAVLRANRSAMSELQYC